VTRRFDNGLSLTAGLRYSDDREALENAGTGLGDDPLAAADESWDDLSWRFGAAWQPNTRLMVFASAATGYKSGGISTVRVPPDDSLDEYEPENLLAFEIGAKWKSADQRRSASVSSFYYDFENLQVLTTAFIDGTPETVVDNAAVARLKGLDLSAEAMLGERLNVTAAVVWLPEREFVEFEAANGPSLSGNELVRAPEWSATASAVYRVLIASHGNFSARADFSYRSAMFYTKENRPRYSQGAYNLLDAWLRYESDNGRWYLFLAGRNLLDTNYFNQVFFQTAPGKPRHYELGFGLNY
jgi:iron complex outermembrane receptor protein